MANITSTAEVFAHQWKRGKGYYGAHGHKVILCYEDFRQAFDQLDERLTRTRYEYYVLSWIMNNPGVPRPEELHPKHGERILDKVAEIMEQEKARAAS